MCDACSPMGTCELFRKDREDGAVGNLFKLLARERYRLQEKELDNGLVRAVLDCLERLKASDFRLSPSEAQQLSTHSSGVGYQEVFSGRDLTMCIFVLRAGAEIPLHDHPQMHVFGRLLFGRMRVLSYELELDESAEDGSNGAFGSQRQRWALLRSDEVFGPDPTTYQLGPIDRNLHALYAVEDCAFFDIVTPPYNRQAGRDCTYYTIHTNADDHPEGFSSPCGSSTQRCLLQAIRSPRSFATEGMSYRGPIPFGADEEHE